MGIMDIFKIDKKEELKVPDRVLDSFLETIEEVNQSTLNFGQMKEINNEALVKQVINLIPKLGNGNCYKVIIPKGAKLLGSKEMQGAMRGLFLDANGKLGHANLVAAGGDINPELLMVVVAMTLIAEYYTSEIMSKLEKINQRLNDIKEFQDNEYRGRVFSLLTHVKKIADFKEEIIVDDELRNAKIIQLDRLEEECTKLLSQANITLETTASKTQIGYYDYMRLISDTSKWQMYQHGLLEILIKISELRYTLHLGKMSRQQSSTLVNTYTMHSEKVNLAIKKWHEKEVIYFRIDMDQGRIRKDGFDGLMAILPGLFDDSQNYYYVDEKAMEQIRTQREDVLMLEIENSDYFNEDVCLVSSNHKLFYRV